MSFHRLFSPPHAWLRGERERDYYINPFAPVGTYSGRATTAILTQILPTTVNKRGGEGRRKRYPHSSPSPTTTTTNVWFCWFGRTVDGRREGGAPSPSPAVENEKRTNEQHSHFPAVRGGGGGGGGGGEEG